MITPDQIRRAVDCLAQAAHPERILLFGSQARGDAREDSDLDLLVIAPEVADRAAEMVRLRRVLRPLRIPADILVYSRDDVARWGDQPGSALYWDIKNSYLKRVDAPVGVKPSLKCWMEINEGT